MVVNYRQDGIEDQKDSREQRNIDSVYFDLVSSLQDHEEYFFQEILKKIHLNGQNSSQKIEKAIDDVLVNDPNQYVQNVDSYKKFLPATGTINDARSMYVDTLRGKLVKGFSRDETDKLIISYIGFLQRKDELLERGKLNPQIADIENFLDIVKGTGEEENNLERIRYVLQRLAVCVEIKRVYIHDELIQSLNNSKNDLLPKEREAIQEIKERLGNILGESVYEGLILDFLNTVEKESAVSAVEMEDIIKKLLLSDEYRYYIVNNVEEKTEEISDYLQRLRPILIKRK